MTEAKWRAQVEQVVQEMTLRMDCVAWYRSQHNCPQNSGYGEWWCNGCLIRGWADHLTALLAVSSPPQECEHGINPTVARCQLCKAQGSPASGGAARAKVTDSAWLVVRMKEQTPEVWKFDDEADARVFHDRAQAQWSECFLARVVKQGAQLDAPASGGVYSPPMDVARLPDDAARILYENLWALYDGQPPDSGGADRTKE